MTKFDTKVDGNTVSGDEYNKVVNPLKNLITSSGQTIDTSNTQVVKAVADYAAVSTFYADSGTANAYVLSAIGSRLAPNAYSEGMEIRFRATNANTGASTVNVAGLGVKNIKQADGSTDLTAADISPNFDTRARYDGTVFRLSNVSDVGNLTVNGKFNTTPTNVTIASGAITYSSAYMVVDTEGGASSDNLDTINGGVDGDEVRIRSTSSTRDITIRDNNSGGNILLKNNIDVLLGESYDTITLKYRSSDGYWFEVNRSLTTDFKHSDAVNGYQYLPSGFIMQWGLATSVGSNATVTVTLPVSYASNNRGAYASIDSVANHDEPVQASILSSSQIQVRNSNVGTVDIRWWSIGF